jgi:hypothetical protein
MSERPPLTEADLASAFAPVMLDIEKRSCVADRFIDKDLYRIYIATLWANVVLDPADVGLTEDDLEPLHDWVNGQLTSTLGTNDGISTCFDFLNSKPGEAAMGRAQLTKNHRELLQYFCSLILDPEGHKRWMDEIVDERDPGP